MKFGLLLFAITVFLQPISQVLERKGMLQIGNISSLGQLLNIRTFVSVITNPYIMTGITLSIIGLILWLGVLSSMKVSYIYPFSAISYIILTILAYIILGENIGMTKWIGMVTIVIGAFILNV